jgi:hypothetical protein
VIADLIAWAFAVFVVEPAMTAANDKLTALRAPQETIRLVGDCARRGGPILAERSFAEPGWAVTTIVRIWMGTTRIEAVLADLDPECAAAYAQARPFLSG